MTDSSKADTGRALKALTKFGRATGVGLKRLVRLIVGKLSKPKDLVWSDKYQCWTKVRLGYRIEWTTLWRQDDLGMWYGHTSYGRDMPPSDQAVPRAQSNP